MIQRYGTRGPATSLTRLMNSLLADPFLSTLANTDGGPVGGSPLNLYEQADNLIVEAEMPGFESDDIDISIERGMLTIRGEMQDEDERQDRNYLVREYRRGTFVRSVRLPDTVDTENVQAEFDNGVLRLIFPKAEQARARRISVGEGSERTGSRRRRSSNGHAANGSDQGSTSTGQSASGSGQSAGQSATQSTGQLHDDGKMASEAQQADARAGRQSQEPAASGAGSHSGQTSSAGSPTSA